MNSNIKPKKTKNQAQNKDFSSFQVQKPEKYFKTYSINELAYLIVSYVKNKRKLLDILSSFANTCRSVWPSVETLAKMVGCRERTIQRYLSQLERDGLIKREIRTYQSNIYHLNPTFFGYWVRKALKEWIPSLAMVPYFIFAVAAAQAEERRRIRLEFESQRTINDYENYVTLLKKNTSYFKKPSHSHSLIERLSKAREPQKGRSVMIPKILLESTAVPLTLAGKIRMCAFDDQAISHAFAEYTKAKNIRDPFAFVFKVTREYQTQTLRKQPNWGACLRLFEQYNVDSDGPYVEEGAQGTPSPRRDGMAGKEKGGRGDGYRNPFPIKPEYQNEEGEVHCYQCSAMNNNPNSSIKPLWEKSHKRDGAVETDKDYVDRRSTAASFLASWESRSPAEQEKLIRNREYAPFPLAKMCKDPENIPPNHPFYGYFLKKEGLVLERGSQGDGSPQPPGFVGLTPTDIPNSNQDDPYPIEEEFPDAIVEW